MPTLENMLSLFVEFMVKSLPLNVGELGFGEVLKFLLK